MAAQQHADSVFMALLQKATAQNRPLSATNRADNFAPKLFALSPERQGLKRKDFELALERLLEAGKIALACYGRKGDERRKIVAAEVRDAA